MILSDLLIKCLLIIGVLLPSFNFMEIDNYLGDKRTIKEAVEKIFNVKVLSVNTSILSAKKRRLGKFQGFKTTYKRAFVTLL